MQANGTTNSAAALANSTAQADVGTAKVIGIHESDFATRARIVRKLGAGTRFGPVNLIRMQIGDESKLFAAKYYEYKDGCENLGDEFASVLNAFNAARHPCLANVLCYQNPVRGAGPIIATEYFEFGSLDSLLNDVRGGKRTELWTPTARVLVICGIVSGLSCLHSHNLFHGSLKPTGILLDSKFNVHLTDYLSFSFEQCHLTFSSMIHSRFYAAPELYTMEDESLDINNADDTMRFMPIDVYAVGLICYELLSGFQAFSPKLSATELRRKTMNSQERPQIPSIIKRDFAKVIGRCWDSDPLKRPAMKEIWHALNQMNFQIIDGVDSDLLKERVTTLSPDE
jgi:serine/threonine protein kinase